MEARTPFSSLVSALAIILVVSIMPVYGQIGTPCTASMITSFTPCINFVTNSTGSTNGSSPTAACCNSLKSITSNSTDCLCLIATGSIPFQIPINRTLAISLPRSCNMPGVPLQCKAAGAPIPAPGPAALGPSLSPKTSPSSSPAGSTVPGSTPQALAPEADATPALTPPSTTGSQAPTANSGSRPVVNPTSAATPSHSLSPSLLLAVLGAAVLNFYVQHYIADDLTISPPPVLDARSPQSSSSSRIPLLVLATRVFRSSLEHPAYTAIAKLLHISASIDTVPSSSGRTTPAGNFSAVATPTGYSKGATAATTTTGFACATTSTVGSGSIGFDF
ncbi:hypothetical protein RJ640_011428 [Escallonia rubra]|uniref:Bifunctional inhibitor/plant lipid transfer protein/seed storage helical domain-containing protein n=1 Tax=Escallonia rubra TaxID=112253 RepID=A0AA88RY87_9ASTE|nr:hypothetical protein RJ640_011428 [Escallonia rubra]